MRFDQPRFWAAVERQRQAQAVSWRQLAAQLSLSPSTFTRLSQGKQPDVDTFVKLLAWLGRPAAEFTVGNHPAPAVARDTVGAIAESLRDDPALSPADAGAL